MTLTSHQPLSAEPPPDGTPVHLLARQLAAAGLGVEVSRHQDTSQLTIMGMAAGKSLITLDTSGHARWYYEPPAGPGSAPATLAAIISYLLSAPGDPASPAAYRTLPFKGQVGRSLQDRGLSVALRVSEDWDSFEATTDIDITNPARPGLGTITLSDDAALDWHLNVPAAFRGTPATLIEVITPILRSR